ncbi:MAG: tRNA pseudouridine(38-40) synthase TruA [Ignavibacterium sp.]
MRNYKIIIQYDGTNYAGWQIQKNKITVQQKITEALEILCKEKINLIGAGRTDSGVHALGQVANFKTNLNLDLYKFRYSLNSILPEDISINRINEVNENFHSRYDAKNRTYLYLISNHKSPFLNSYSLFLNDKIDIKKLNLLSNILIGEYDFSALSKIYKTKVNKICKIFSANWKFQKGIYIFKIEGNRFLHGMVRIIVGTLLSLLNKTNSEELLKEILIKQKKDFVGKSVSPRGLFLYKIKY